MRKCPRCGHEISDKEKYCSHCGLDLRGKYIPIKQGNRRSSFLIYIVIIFSMMTIPMMYMNLLNNMTQSFAPTMSQESTDLPPVIDQNATSILATFDTLSAFQRQYTNVDRTVQAIESYEHSLESQMGYQFHKTYFIAVLNNYNVSYSLKYDVKINDQLSVRIEKLYDRAHKTNQEKIIVKKDSLTTFQDLFFTDEDIALLKNVIEDQDKLIKVMDGFKSREEELEQKKDKLGHFGIGNYEDDSSFVVHREKDTYYSEYTYSFEPADYVN